MWKLDQKESQAGARCWLFRWSEKGTPGKRVYRKRVIGTLEEYSDVDAARCAVTGLIAKINGANPRKGQDSMTIAQLCNHFEQPELAQSNGWRSYATKKCYAVYLRRWIVPHWENMSFAMSERLRLSAGFVGCHWQRAVAQRSEI